MVLSPANSREYRYFISPLDSAIQSFQVPDVLAIHIQVDEAPYFAFIKDALLKIRAELLDEFIQYAFNRSITDVKSRFASVCYIAQCRRKSYFDHLNYLMSEPARALYAHEYQFSALQVSRIR